MALDARHHSPGQPHPRLLHCGARPRGQCYQALVQVRYMSTRSPQRACIAFDSTKKSHCDGHQSHSPTRPNKLAHCSIADGCGAHCDPKTGEEDGEVSTRFTTSFVSGPNFMQTICRFFPQFLSRQPHNHFRMCVDCMHQP